MFTAVRNKRMKNVIYIGIDPSDERQNYSLAAMDEEENILALSRGRLDGILSFAAGQTSALIAIHVPYSTPKDPKKKKGSNTQHIKESRWDEQNVQPSLSVDFTAPGNPNNSIAQFKIHRNTEAFQKSRVLCEQLTGLGYIAYQDTECTRGFLMTHTESVCYRIISAPLFAGKTLEGRLQRQLLLAECGVKVADPMVFFEEVTRYKLLHGVLPINKIYDPMELNAMICSYVAWGVQHLSGKKMCKMDAGTESIWLPTGNQFSER